MAGGGLPSKGDDDSFDADVNERLDAEAFPAFTTLLVACQEYAELSGSRFKKGYFREFDEEVAKAKLQSCSGELPPLVTAKLKAAPVVNDYVQRMRKGDQALLDGIDSAHRSVMAESIRSAVVATCQELQLWPPRPTPRGIDVSDCAYQDMTAMLPEIAQRAYNDETRRKTENALRPLVRRATTASFIMDFAGEAAGVAPPILESHHEMLEDFMERVEEWVSTTRGWGSAASPADSRSARRACMSGLGPGTAADNMRQQVQARWSKNWETHAGTALNVAAAGLALFAGYAALRRTGRR